MWMHYSYAVTCLFAYLTLQQCIIDHGGGGEQAERLGVTIILVTLVVDVVVLLATGYREVWEALLMVKDELMCKTRSVNCCGLGF